MGNVTAAWRWCSSRLSRRRGDDRSAVLVIVALLLPLIMGTAALVIDVGFWYLTQAQLQAAADAVALAGAQQLPSSPSSAQAYAQSLAARNVSGATVTPVTGPIWFGSVIGISAPTITASAVAQNTAGTGSFIYAASTACNAISIVNSGGASFVGDVFAPAGQVSLTMSGGTGTNGFLEASAMSFTNSGYTSVTGSGPTSSGGVSLIG